MTIIDFNQLINMSQSEDVNDREQSARFLLNFVSNEKAERILMNLLKDENWRVRKSAAETILFLKTPSLMKEVVKTLYNDDNAGARNAAMEILLNLGEYSLPYLRCEYQTEHPDVKLFIANLSGDLKDADALPFLYRCLSDNNENVIASAIVSLGKIGSADSVASLSKFIYSENPWYQYQAIEALGLIGHPDCIVEITTLLPNVFLRDAIIKALSTIDDEKSVAALCKCLKEKPSADLVVALTNLLFLPRPTVLKTALESLYFKTIQENLTLHTIKELLTLATQSSDEIMYESLRLLTFIQEKQAIELLKPLLCSTDTMMKGFELLKRYEPEALLQLKGFIEDLEDDLILYEYLSLFWNAKSKACIDYSKLFLSSDNDQIRFEAYKIITHVLAEQSIPFLLKALEDPNPTIHEFASATLLEMTRTDTTILQQLEQEIETLLASHSDHGKALALYIGCHINGKKYAPKVLEGIKSDSSFIRKKALQCIALEKNHLSFDYAKNALADEDSKIRELAVHLLGDYNNDESLNLLVSAFDDEDIWVKIEAIRSLSKRPTPKVYERLKEKYLHAVAPLQIEMLQYFGAIDHDACRQFLIERLHEEDDTIRITAAQSLAPFSKAAQEALLHSAQHDKNWKVREEALTSLSRKPPKHFDTILVAIAESETDAFVRKTLLHIMHTLPVKNIPLFVLKWFEDPRLMDSVMQLIQARPAELMSEAKKLPFKISNTIERSLKCITTVRL
jgi:HEAT repeat protein